jgi:hypothetical protein
MGATAIDWLHDGRSGVMTAAQGLEIVPVRFSEVIGHNRPIDARFFRLVRQFVVEEEPPAGG